MVKQKKTTARPLHHTLREFLFSLSYWGSWTRSLLFFVIVTAILVLALSGVAAGLTTGSQHFWFTTFGITSALIYTAVFFLYDAAYVTLVRRFPAIYLLDKLVLFSLEAIAVTTIFIVALVYTSTTHLPTVYLAVLGAVLVLPLRVLAGVLTQKDN